MRTELLAGIAVVALSSSPARATESASALAPSASKATTGPSIDVTAMGGLVLPSCFGQRCEGSLASAPSVRALALYQPSPGWAFGLAGQMAFVHWKATYLPFTATPTMQSIESDLSVGLLGIAVRYNVLPEMRVTPLVELVMGSSFQMQTGSNFNCNRGFIPAGQLGLGASARITSALSLIAIASATAGIRGSDCDVSDGAPATPLAAWGYGLHAGASFDVGLGSASPGTGLARR